ncbi:hypothetical protein SAMN05444959_10873 [Paracoccus seriniphilus]|uniref:Uncharacterized protein n=1 Tax=Paracoccus seriniphilus TaxID=184748 RepID=A0A239PXD8_9RHOB|nr:hypothetical protein SAMN05444959_10873 [Paracoccus seriniphilus]
MTCPGALAHSGRAETTGQRQSIPNRSIRNIDRPGTYAARTFSVRITCATGAFRRVTVPHAMAGTEVEVDGLSADIAARNPMDGSIRLIEKQLETTDHIHLGQIMTYLAGLKAQSVLWIASSFRKPELSAIR